MISNAEDQSRGSALLVDDHDDILLHDEELDEVPEDLEDEARQEYIHLTRGDRISTSSYPAPSKDSQRSSRTTDLHEEKPPVLSSQA